MGAMNDFWGEPLFQPTGTDWIDHASTAAVLDDMEREEQARRSLSFSTPTMGKATDRDAGVHIKKSTFRISKDAVSFEEFVEQFDDLCQFLAECGGFMFKLPQNANGCLIAPFSEEEVETLAIYMDSDDARPLNILLLLIEGLLIRQNKTVKIKNWGLERFNQNGKDWCFQVIKVTIDE